MRQVVRDVEPPECAREHAEARAEEEAGRVQGYQKGMEEEEEGGRSSGSGASYENRSDGSGRCGSDGLGGRGQVVGPLMEGDLSNKILSVLIAAEASTYSANTDMTRVRENLVYKANLRILLRLTCCPLSLSLRI